MSRRAVPIVLVVSFLFSSLACRTVVGGSAPSSAPIVSTAAPLPTSNLPPITIPDLVTFESVLTSLYTQASQGVVAIRVLTEAGDGLGSGFVYDNQGHIITNYHVIEGVTDLEVDFLNGKKVRGRVIGVDLDSDIAVIQVDLPAQELYPLPMGDSNQLKVGQMVVAIGTPFDLSGSMTVGYISALGRTLDSMRVSTGGNFFTAGDLIQTDAAINPGNSGGPLLNLKGEVVGINRAIRTENFSMVGEPVNTGIGFAVSINIIKRVVPSLIAKGKYDYPYVGIYSLDEISLMRQEALKLSRSTGAYVTGVIANGPAERAGLRGGTAATNIPGLSAGGDLIIAIDGMEVLTFGDFLSYLINNKSPGDRVTLTILRDNKEMEVELTLDSRP